MSLTSKVIDYFRLRSVKGELGIEVEVETNSEPPEVNGWRFTHDGSLRGYGGEYISPPILRKDVDNKLALLRSSFKNRKWKDSVRAGVHVHVNMQDNTFEDVVKFTVLYYIFENILLDYCGDSRKGNLFCLRAEDAEHVVSVLTAALRTGDYWTLDTDQIRYCALNLRSLPTKGTMEFRAMGTYKNFEKIDVWANLLLDLKESALSYRTISEIIDDFSMSGPEMFFEKNLGKYRKHLNVEKYNWNDLYENMRLAQDIVHYKYF